LRTTEPPQSPEGWENWFLRITRMALKGKYLTYRYSPAADRQTFLAHASCQRRQAAQAQRPKEHSI
jgi:RNA-directed DNA polymerase